MTDEEKRMYEYELYEQQMEVRGIVRLIIGSGENKDMS